eukprot:gb/GECH01010447.1/.p1 GENE.gb/GECH01010447.1/~~gb/GECH01010447.1/.p1  ORF type:complete len:901 (+),score=161.28 gb/GECH01010447.1/:1-2703(+)
MAEEQSLIRLMLSDFKKGTWMRIWHTIILIKKNVILYWRRWKSSLVQILAPFVIVALLFVLSIVAENSAAGKDTNPLRSNAGPIPSCKPWNTDQPCYTFIYSINPSLSSDTKALLNSTVELMIEDEPNVNPDNVLRMEDYEQIVDFNTDSPNRTANSIYFDATESPLQTVVNYTVLFNLTTTDMPDTVPAVTAAVERALLQVTTEEANSNSTQSITTNVDVYKKGFPRPRELLNGEVLIFSINGAVFFSFALQLILVVTMYSVVLEKENKLRFGMKMMGLKDISYWTSWLLTAMAISFLSSLVTIISGYIFQLQFFLNCNFFVLMAVFLTYSLSLISLAFALSAFITTVKAALILGFVILGTTFLLNIFLANGFLVYLLYSEDVNPGWRTLFSFYPPFNFAKAFTDITFATQPVFNPETREYEAGPGYSFTEFWDENNARGITAPPTADSMYWLILNTTIFFVLGWYLDNALPTGGAGVSRGFFFFLSLSYWGLDYRRKPIKTAIEKVHPPDHDANTDDDLKAETERARNTDTILEDGSDSLALRTAGLRKQFSNLFGKNFVAVKGLDLAVNPGTCLALLGHNGAGKTTTISMLVGLIPPSGGEAYVYSNSIRSDVDTIRSTLGVCPQHDILWDDLTAREHLTMFCQFKGIPWSKINEEVDQRLKDVALYAVGNKTAGTYSGGMKRRLSVAISCIGNPNMILLDEPTTGMDPHSKRQVWELIHNMKGSRVILLTTHSMEEADALSDRIAIMAHGELRCVGDSLHLKHKYGAGYNVKLVGNSSATTTSNVMRDMESQVQQYIPEATLVSENAGNMIFNVPSDKVVQLGQLVEHIESQVGQDGSIIRDWGLSHTSLEEVYLKVTSEAKFGFTSKERDVEMKTQEKSSVEQSEYSDVEVMDTK